MGPASAARVPGKPPSPAPTPTAPEWPPSSPRAGSGPRRRGRREQGREGSRGAASGAARAGAAGKASPGALRHPHPPPPRPAAGSDPCYRAAVGGGTGWPGPADSARLREPHRSPPSPGRRPGAPGAGAEAGSWAAFRKAAEEIRTPSGPRGFLEKQAQSSGSSLATTLRMEASPAAFVTHGCPHPATGFASLFIRGMAHSSQAIANYRMHFVQQPHLRIPLALCILALPSFFPCFNCILQLRVLLLL